MGQIKKLIIFATLFFSIYVLAAEQRPFSPSFIASVKNSQNLYSIASKNKWFLDFKQSPLFYGLVYDLYPALFSLPDEFSVSKESTWSGRFIDYFYESVLKNRPVQVFYYQQSRLASPWGFSVSGLSGAESKAADQLIKLFKMGEDKEVSLSDSIKGTVSLIEIKAQKWALKREGSCLTIARDPRVAYSAGQKCKPPKISSDLELDINLSLAVPSLMKIREKVVGLSETMKVPFQWNGAENRFDLAPISVGLNKENIFVTKKIVRDFLKIIPADSHFFVMGNIKIWNGNMTVENVKNFLASKNRGKSFQKQAAAVLIQIPVKKDDLITTENALILETNVINQSQLDNVGAVFESRFGEVFIRPICAKTLVISRSKELLQKVQNVCDRKAPSILDRSELNAAQLMSQDSSLSLFADLGKWVSYKIEAGYLTKAKQKKLPLVIPRELLESQKLLEQLPKYLVKGSAKDQNLILK